MCSTAKLGIVPEDMASVATCIVQPYNEADALNIAILSKLGKGRHVHMCAWAENIANVWLPYTNIWENFKVP